MAAGHYISHLRLTDFRNYAALDIDFSGAPVVLHGENGAGKTNLLEAVSLLSPGRGLRRARLEALTRQEGESRAPAWGVNASLMTQDDMIKLAIGQVPEAPRRRVIRIDDKTVSGTALSAYVTLFWLTPAQDRLFTGPASDRRKFLDRFTLMQAPDHGANVLSYEKLRAERNRLLGENISDRGWYEALEWDMARYGAKIASARTKTLYALSDEIDRRPETVFPKSRLALEGEIEDLVQSGLSEEEVSERFAQLLADNRSLDIRAGRTLRGVHRADLLVSHVPKSMSAASCSTGEQKALLIGLMLAQAHAQSDKHPFLLLDEVAAHLDSGRRAALTEELIDLGTQVFLTGTDAALFEAFDGRADMFEVRGGTIT